jgi:hypothetical protein
MRNKLSISLAIALAVAIGIIVYLLNDNGKLNVDIEQSKGRVQVIEKLITEQKHVSDSIIKLLQTDTAALHKTKASIIEIPKYYAVEKNRIAHLPVDSALLLFSKRYSSKKRGN